MPAPEDAALSNLRRIDVFNASHTPHNDNQHNRKAHNDYCANCHNVICNKVSILEVVPRHPHSFEPPRNYRCPGMNDEAPISRLGRAGLSIGNEKTILEIERVGG
jgi:hypothetical protein